MRNYNLKNYATSRGLLLSTKDDIIHISERSERALNTSKAAN